jgi:hypothetical protein
MSDNAATPSRHIIAASMDPKLHELTTRTARAYNTSASAIVVKALEMFFSERPDIVAVVTEQPQLPEL